MLFSILVVLIFEDIIYSQGKDTPIEISSGMFITLVSQMKEICVLLSAHMSNVRQKFNEA